MPGNTIGEAFRVTTCGESHGPAIGYIDGCPPGRSLDEHSHQLHDLIGARITGSIERSHAMGALPTAAMRSTTPASPWAGLSWLGLTRHPGGLGRGLGVPALEPALVAEELHGGRGNGYGSR